MDKKNFCNLCLLQCANKFVYDIHMSVVHKIVIQQDKNEKLTEDKGSFLSKVMGDLISVNHHWPKILTKI